MSTSKNSKIATSKPCKKFNYLYHHTWHPNIDTGWAPGSPSDIVVLQASVVDPAVDDERHQQLQVQPDVEVVRRGLLADVVDHRGFVYFGLELTATVAWDC